MVAFNSINLPFELERNSLDLYDSVGIEMNKRGLPVLFVFAGSALYRGMLTFARINFQETNGARCDDGTATI